MSKQWELVAMVFTLMFGLFSIGLGFLDCDLTCTLTTNPFIIMGFLATGFSGVYLAYFFIEIISMVVSSKQEEVKSK